MRTVNIDQVIAVAEKLGEMKDDVVFVGGSATELLVDEAARMQARQTEDVDFIVNITTNMERFAFDEKMRSHGFREDASKGAPLCRWIMDYNGLTLKVDAMPVGESIYGFVNQWYEGAIQNAWVAELDDGLSIRVIDPVYFLGTKFEAYKDRGNGDIYSHDLEDIFYVLENRSEIELLVFEANEDIKSYLKKEFSDLQTHPDLENSAPGLLNDPSALDMVMGRIEFIVNRC